MPAGRALAVVLVSGTAAGAVLPFAAPAASLAAALAACSLAVVVADARVRRGLIGVALLAAAIGHGAAARDRVLHAPLVRWFGEAHGADTRHVVIVEGRLARDAERFDDGARIYIDVHRIVDR